MKINADLFWAVTGQSSIGMLKVEKPLYLNFKHSWEFSFLFIHVKTYFYNQ